MCFAAPKVPPAPPLPSKSSEDASARRQAEANAVKASQGRASTIVTSPLGVSNFGEDVRRTRIAGV